MVELTKLFVGDNIKSVTNEVNRQRIVLTGIITTFAIIACTFYMLVEVLIGEPNYIPLYAVTILTSAAAIYLQRHGFFDLAKYVFLIPSITIISFFTVLEGRETGLYMYFAPLSIYAFSVFAHEKIYHAIIIIVDIITNKFLRGRIG